MAVLTGRRHRANVLKSQKPKKSAGRPRDPRREQALALIDSGKKAREVEEILGVPQSTIGTWIRERAKTVV